MKRLLPLFALALSTAAQADIRFECTEVDTANLAACPYRITGPGAFQCSIDGGGDIRRVCAVRDLAEGWRLVTFGCRASQAFVQYRPPGTYEYMAPPGAAPAAPPEGAREEAPPASAGGYPIISQGQIYLDSWDGRSYVLTTGARRPVGDRRIEAWYATGAARMVAQGPYVSAAVAAVDDAARGDKYTITYVLRVEGHGVKAENETHDEVTVSRNYIIQ